jgi:hypothetical protein
MSQQVASSSRIENLSSSMIEIHHNICEFLFKSFYLLCVAVSFSVLSGHEVIFKKEFQIEKRELRLASRVSIK